MNQQSRYSVQDLLRMALPVGTTVVAGQAGMGRRVKWVSVLNTRPPAFPDLAGGELALISLDAMRLLSDKLTLASLIHDLSEMEVAAIAVAGEIGTPAIDAANEREIPLLHLPDTAQLRAIEKQVGQLLIGNPVAPEERGREVREQLLQLSTENRGLQALTAALADLVGKTVVVQDKGCTRSPRPVR